MSDLIKDTASSNYAQNPYADIDRLIANQNSLLEQQQAQQNQILDNQLQMQIDQINRSKSEVDENAAKTNSGLYSEYKKASNRYGPNAENLYTQGLGNSGFAESTQTNLYNTYQKNITDTLNTAQKLKSDFDFQIQQAMQNRDLQAAQFALELYKQKMNLATQEYDLRNNKEQDLYNRSIDERNYNYQVGRDNVADNQWNRQFEYQQARDNIADNQWQKSFDYQAGRDAISDSQWEKQYQQMLKEYADSEKWKQANFDYQKQRDSISDKQYQDQFDYQKSRDAVSDSQWNQNFNYQVGRDQVADNQWQQTFDYQKSRDSVADNQWEREFALAQQAKASSGSSRKSGGSGGSGGNYTIDLNDNSSKLDGIYQSYLNMRNSLKVGPFDMGKAMTLDNFLSSAVADNKITAQEAKQILDKYGN